MHAQATPASRHHQNLVFTMGAQGHGLLGFISMYVCFSLGYGILWKSLSGVPDGKSEWGEKVIYVCGHFNKVQRPSSGYAQASPSPSLVECFPL